MAPFKFPGFNRIGRGAWLWSKALFGANEKGQLAPPFLLV